MKSVSMKGLVDHRIEEKNRLQESAVNKKVIEQFNVVSIQDREYLIFTMKQPITIILFKIRRKSKRKPKK